MVMDHEAHKVKSTASHLFVLETVPEQYEIAIACRTYRLSNQSSRYDETVSSHFAKVAKKITSQMKVHFLNFKHPIFIIGFLATLNWRVIQAISTKEQSCGYYPTS